MELDNLERVAHRFFDGVQRYNLIKMNDDIKYQILNHLKLCIKLDVCIQKLIEQEPEQKYSNVPVNVVNLHNNKHSDLVKRLENVHLDNLGIFAFQYLENLLKEKGISSIGVPPKKAGANVKEINYDTLLENFEKEHFIEFRLRKDALINMKDGKLEYSSLDKKDRISLSNIQHQLLEKEYVINSEGKMSGITRYDSFFLTKSKENNKKNGKEISTREIRTWYVPLYSANVLSFQLFYNSAFDFLSNVSIVINQKNTQSKLINLYSDLLRDITLFCESTNLENYLETEEYKKAVFADRVVLLSKIDFLYNWILFSSCFSNYSLFVENPDEKETVHFDNVDTFAFEYIMKKTRIGCKNELKGINNFANHLFFSKWYLLSLLKYVKFYDYSSFIDLFNVMISYFENISKEPHTINESIEFLYQSSLMIDLMTVRKSENRVNTKLLQKLSNYYGKSINCVARRIKLDDFYPDIFINKEILKMNENMIRDLVKEEIIKVILLYFETSANKEFVDNKSILEEYQKNQKLRNWVMNGLEEIGRTIKEQNCTNEFEKGIVDRIIDSLTFETFGIDDLLKI